MNTFFKNRFFIFWILITIPRIHEYGTIYILLIKIIQYENDLKSAITIL